MRTILNTSLIVLLCVVCYSFAPEDVNTKGAKKYFYTSYLACSETDVSFLPKRSFDSLIHFRLCAKDSNKNQAPIQSFEILYAERGLYQDSTGLPIIFTDYTTVQCKGDTIPKKWIDLFKERSYKGDTVFFENMKVLGPANKSYACKGMKIVIQ